MMRIAALVQVLLLCAPAGAADYHLGAGDLLKINVSGYPEMAADVRISQTGSISYPFVGQLEVVGLSTNEVETLLVRRLTDGGFIRQPQVSVLVSDYQSQKVAVMGQVARPGQYPLDGARTVIDLLAQAGGLVTPTAADQGTVLRANGTRIPLDLYALFEGDSNQNFPVAAGDTIFVPKAPQFYIYGEVQRPGAYRLERRMSVSQAISAGGGLTPRGSDRRLAVRRLDARGKLREVPIDGAGLLQPDDVLIVKESLF